jgi:hypothetical protein
MHVRQSVPLVLLVALIIILTAAIAGRAPSSPALGAIAPIIIPALLTWYVIMLVINSKWIVELLAAFLGKGPGERTQAHPFMTIIAWGLLVTIGLVLLRIVPPRGLAAMLQQTARLFIRLGNQTLSASQIGSVTNPTLTTVILYYYSIAMFGVIILASFSLFFLSLRKAYQDVREVPSAKEEKLRDEALGAVQTALTELKSNGEYHETILKCYKHMCSILSERGFRISSTQTAREFSNSLSGKLRLGEHSVRGLTFLFEEARYSDHQIVDEKRVMAVGELNLLQRALTESNGENP